MPKTMMPHKLPVHACKCQNKKLRALVTVGGQTEYQRQDRSFAKNFADLRDTLSKQAPPGTEELCLLWWERTGKQNQLRGSATCFGTFEEDVPADNRQPRKVEMRGTHDPDL